MFKDDLAMRTSTPLLRSRAYSKRLDGSLTFQTPLEMGRHEMYELLPFTAVFGLQKKQMNLSKAYTSYAADLDVSAALQSSVLNLEQQEERRNRVNLLLMEEMEMEKKILTPSLIFAVMIASLSQFLVGYNIGVMNAPADVVFVGHSTAQWSLAVAFFAIGESFIVVIGNYLLLTYFLGGPFGKHSKHSCVFSNISL